MVDSAGRSRVMRRIQPGDPGENRGKGAKRISNGISRSGWFLEKAKKETNVANFELLFKVDFGSPDKRQLRALGSKIQRIVTKRPSRALNQWT